MFFLADERGVFLLTPIRKPDCMVSISHTHNLDVQPALLPSELLSTA